MTFDLGEELSKDSEAREKLGRYMKQDSPEQEEPPMLYEAGDPGPWGG